MTIGWIVLVMAAIPAFATQAPSKVPAFAGTDTCMGCHEDLVKSFLKSRHGVVNSEKRRGWENQACESCHGSGVKHAESASAEDIRQPAKLAASEADKTCATCHAGQSKGPHGRNQVACTTCHSIHKTEPEALVARKASTVNSQCSSCHVSEWAQFQRPHGHKLPQGAMSCVDCHNPHGSSRAKSIQTAAANEPGCFKCHGDKRGPFTFEHAAVKIDGCATCHEPHGSANPRMLTRAEQRMVCLECHANIGTPQAGGVPPAFHDLRSSRYQNCTICHVKVHGSHVNRTLLR